MNVKDNAQILADQQAFMAAYERAREAFKDIDGVLGVGFGQKQRGGEFTDDVGIIVFVREKKPEEDLAPADRIPPVFEGYRTDVRTVLQAVPGGCDNDSEYSRIQGGIQIEAQSGTEFGTLGCIVRRRGDTGRENVYLLSNKHVLYAGGTTAGDHVFHPYTPSPAGAPPRASTALGPIQDNAFYQNVTATVPDAAGQPVTDTFFIDCAIARIDIDSKCFGSTCTKDVIEYDPHVVDLALNGANTLSDVRSVARDVSIAVPRPGTGGPYVFKVGRTTGRTKGIVRSVNAVLRTSDPTVAGSPTIRGLNVIEIDFDRGASGTGVNCHGQPWFAERGDSGSIVVDENSRVIGIITAVPSVPNTNQDSAVACHILPVLDRLGVCIPTTTGSSHGSCRATDGSGTAPAPTASLGADVESGFASAPLTGELRAPAGETLRAPAGETPAGEAPRAPAGRALTNGEREHMLRLRDEFVRTEAARELHDIFGQVRREIGYLVRNCRPVTIAWYRNRGPAFMAHVLNHLRGETDMVPLEVDGVSRAQLLTRMADVLRVHGSNPLRAAIERYRDALMPVLSSAGTVHEGIARLHATEAHATEAEAASR